MDTKIVLLVISFISFTCQVQSASILALFSSLSFSDHIVFKGYVSLLASRGHSVVMMTPYPGHFTQTEMEKIVELNVGDESSKYWEEYLSLMKSTDDYYTKMANINELNLKIATAQLSAKKMTALFANPNVKFDLIITEADLPVLNAAAEKYKVPLIGITTSTGKLHQYESKGISTHPLLYPDVNTQNYEDLSLLQKINEVSKHLSSKYEYYNNYVPMSQTIAQKIFGVTKDLVEIEREMDMLFVAANPLLTGNRPRTFSITYVDRMHIKPGFKLSEDLQSIMDTAKNGVIYFSLGAIHEPEKLPQKTLQILADTFAELPYTFLWKIANVSIINVPKNVVAQPWFPQQEILAHPNLKVFITHGGARSLEEALYYEVPIVGLPLVNSRKVFIKEITKHGAGEILDVNSLEKNAFKSAISNVANNKKYKNAMSRVKYISNDPLISGPDNALWWTEYVIRNGGAKHLRSNVLNYSLLSYYMLDVLLYLVIGISVVVGILYYAVLVILKRFKSRSNAKRGQGGKFKAL